MVCDIFIVCTPFTADEDDQMKINAWILKVWGSAQQSLINNSSIYPCMGGWGGGGRMEDVYQNLLDMFCFYHLYNTFACFCIP